ncbi:MAG TPA: hypothetical protein VNS02_10010 [Rhizobiaceae bacterium]|nr:hypothetical protein [Rhizobiaceae bacterium]
MRRAFRAGLMLAALALSGCNNTAAVLDPNALQPVGADRAPEVAAPIAPPASATMATPPPAVAAIAPGSARVFVAPVVGAAENAATPLAQQLSVRATERGIALVPAGTANATHMLKGYFSAFTEGSQTTVIYVWDVLDPSGNRLHRIQGQEKESGGGGEGWSAVTQRTMQAIADRTIDDLTAWLAARAG